MNLLADVTRGLINLVLAIAGILLGLRFILKLFSANADNDFVNWIYETSGEVLAPFRGVFSTASIDGAIVEFSTIFAMLAYALVGMLAFYLVELLTPNQSKKRG